MKKLRIWQWGSKSYYWVDRAANRQNINNMLTCPHCPSSKIVKNGFTSYGKQNYRCHSCQRQAGERTDSVRFKREEILQSLLLERISLRAIARTLNVSLGWVVKRAKQYWQSVDKELPVGRLEQPELALYCLEADEMWRSAARSFVGAKDCPEWIWPPWNGWRSSDVVDSWWVFTLGGVTKKGPLVCG
ncbi:IS1/IS1595 family N-terminal zinc-binding domain-containing protein [Tunicatimonas pelagia]|uniref:IS1/IS1595 family N-terminal zinc-binding domain-containing protein n=1 Tax=Tunicatimonas pelagia TaxID=931531 RepID=UPI002666FAB1|nr:hypothetical protein [Tunicatimonas pelagia]WKN44378.1 hypothetical protein P0M28_05290 [Tunicatimonas pelagia]